MKKIYFTALILFSSIYFAAKAQQNGTLLMTTQKTNAKATAIDLSILKNQHFEQNTGITPQTVRNMKLKWMVETQSPVSHVPIPDQNFIYFGDWGGNIYKVNKQNGNIVWKKTLEQPKEWPWHGFAGPGAIDDNNYYVASVEGMAWAVNKDNGDVVWKTSITNDPQAGSLAKLLVYDNKVYIGLQSVEEPLSKMKKGFKPDFTGKVMALDAQTGKQVWETQLVQPPNNGVAVWSSFAVDPETNTLFFDTGNNYTGDATENSDAVIAVDAQTGKLKWKRQIVNNDVWTPQEQIGPDYDFAGGPQLFEATINGQPRALIGAANKNGVFYVMDRNTGEPVWSTVIGYSGIEGGMHAEASIAPDRLLMWSNNGYFHERDPKKHYVSIKALDKATGKPLWVKNKVQNAAYGAGFLAGDVYFVGDLGGNIMAYDAAKGDSLWSTDIKAPVTSWIWGDCTNIYFSTGTPKILPWSTGKSGIYAYGIKPQPGIECH